MQVAPGPGYGGGRPRVHREFLVTESSPRLAPRSAGAIADTELLRVARTDIAPPEPIPGVSLADRIRAALLRLSRSEA